jgi:SAM-dependent methyltransferase
MRRKKRRKLPVRWFDGETALFDRACPVCCASECRRLLEIGLRQYIRCPVCEAVFVHPEHRPDRESERARYDLHNNSPEDDRYVLFLRKLADPLIERLKPEAEGLDYGCGPTPLLSELLKESRFPTANYDPFFFPVQAALERTYDFITCSEAAEHFHRPHDEFARLNRLLRPGGTLAVMTSFLDGVKDFVNWHYRRDETHVVFYSTKTFRVIASCFGWEAGFPAPNLTYLLKPQS